MGFTARLLVAVTLVGFITECHSVIAAFKEITDCFKKELAAARRKDCWFDPDCESAKIRTAIQTCIMHGFNLIYQDSSYYKKGDYDTYRLIECAIDQCFEGVKRYGDTQKRTLEEPQSDLAESFYHCLLGVRECVQDEWSHTEL